MKDRLDKILDQIEEGRLDQKLKEEAERKALEKQQLIDRMELAILKASMNFASDKTVERVATLQLTPEEYHKLLQTLQLQMAAQPQAYASDSIAIGHTAVATNSTAIAIGYSAVANIEEDNEAN